MTETTYSFRVGPPLYRLNGAEFPVRRVEGLSDARISVTLVDSGVPTDANIVTSGSGASVTLPGDNIGLLHNSRIDILVPGGVADRPHVENRTLAAAVNRLIDWYRLMAGHPEVRRVRPADIGGYEATDSDGGRQIMMNPLGASPGAPSATAGAADSELVGRMVDAVVRPLPLWSALALDSQAELAAAELRVAVLLANSAMETLINVGFRAVAPPAEVESAFSEDSPASFWQLIKRLNEIVETGRQTTELNSMASRVNRYRNDVSHGNPVVLDEVVVREGVRALFELGTLIDAAVVSFLTDATR